MEFITPHSFYAKGKIKGENDVLNIQRLKFSEKKIHIHKFDLNSKVNLLRPELFFGTHS